MKHVQFVVMLGLSVILWKPALGLSIRRQRLRCRSS